MNSEENKEITRRYITGLERENELKDKMITAQNKLIAELEDYIHKLKEIYDQFPSILQ